MFGCHAYVFEGQASPGDHPAAPVDAGNLVIFGAGDLVRIQAPNRDARFLLVAGRPLAEPVAWGGPIVMNTDQELRQAFEDHQRGTFLDP